MSGFAASLIAFAAALWAEFIGVVSGAPDAGVIPSTHEGVIVQAATWGVCVLLCVGVYLSFLDSRRSRVEFEQSNIVVSPRASRRVR